YSADHPASPEFWYSRCYPSAAQALRQSAYRAVVSRQDSDVACRWGWMEEECFADPAFATAGYSGKKRLLKGIQRPLTYAHLNVPTKSVAHWRIQIQCLC